MQKILRIVFLFLIIIFFGSTYKYYSSNKNIKNKEFNRKNIEEILNDKKYIVIDETTEVIQISSTILRLNKIILFHLSCLAKEAINLTEVVSKPNLASKVKILRTVIAKTKLPKPCAPYL